MADNVMVMYAGKTVEYTDVISLYQNPMHPYTWGLLDSIPKRDSEKNEPLNTIEGNPPDLRNTGVGCNFAGRCPYAEDICTKKQPPLLEIKPGHIVSCHFQTKDKRLERRRDING